MKKLYILVVIGILLSTFMMIYYTERSIVGTLFGFLISCITAVLYSSKIEE